MAASLLPRLAVLAAVLLLLLPVPGQAVESGIRAWYPLSGDFRDHSSSGRDGAVHGAVIHDPLSGPFAAVARFDGGWIALPAEAGEWRGFTLSAWVWFDDARGAFTPLIGRFGISGTGNGLAYATGEPGAEPALKSAQILPWKRWAHVALVHHAETGSLEVWMGGWMSARLEAGPALPSPFAPGFGLGGGGGSVFTGRMAEVLVHDRALSADEIRDLAQGMGRQRPIQVAASEGCGGLGQPPCRICSAYAPWPPARWTECGSEPVPWCLGGRAKAGDAACP